MEDVLGPIKESRGQVAYLYIFPLRFFLQKKPLRVMLWGCKYIISRASSPLLYYKNLH